MNRDTVDSTKATEILKEMLKLNFEAAKGFSPPSSSIVEATSLITTQDYQTYSNGKSGGNSGFSTMKPGNEMDEDEKQEIILTANNDSVSHRVFSNDVSVICHKSNHTSGSNRVKIINIVNSVWECRYYFGQLVTVHLSKDFIAYVIKLPNSDDRAIRVMNRKTKGRILLKGMRGLVADLSFAHICNEVILGAVDEYGNIFVYSIKEEGPNLSDSLILEVRRSEENASKSKFRRLIWCPFVEESNSDEELDTSDCAKLMVVTYGLEAEIWNVDTILKEYGCGPLSPEGLSEGYQLIKEHILPVTDAAFPPDGTALATSSDDGSVKFYQVDKLDSNEKQSCLHNWIPHEGKPLSCIFFLDDKSFGHSDVQYWKYAITGCDQNRELKVWNCASWQCLQTIRFQSPEDVTLKPELKARLDESAEFLILSNITHRVLYVLRVYQERENNIAKIISISEFPVTSPILSFDILGVGHRSLEQISDDQLEEFAFNESLMGDELSEETAKLDAVGGSGLVVKLVYVQPKSLQECMIVFQPTASFNKVVGSVRSASQDSLHFKDKLSDVSFDKSMLDESSGDLKHRSSFNNSADKTALLTPDVFSMLPKESSSSIKSAIPERNVLNFDDLPSPNSSLHMSPSVTHGKSTDVTPLKAFSPKNGDDHVQKRDSLKSTGSSPSLEVQEILNKSLVEELIEDKNDDLQLINTGPCIPEDFTNQPPSVHMNWPTTTTIPQPSVVAEEKISPPSKSAKNNQTSDKVLLERVSGNVLTISQSMQNIIRLLDSQQAQLNTLKEGIVDIQSGKSKQMTMMGNYQNEVTNALKVLLEKHHHAETSIISGLLKSHEDRLLTTLSQFSANFNVNRLEQVIKSEFQSSVVPLLLREMKHMENIIHTELTNRLAIADSLLKENLNKLVDSKSFTSAVSATVAATLQGCYRPVFQEMVRTNVMPTFERLCQNMFLQIDEAFRSGTREYAQRLNDGLDKDFRRNQEFVNGELQDVISKIQESKEQLTTSASGEINNQLHVTLKKFEDQLSSRVMSILQEQMSVAMKEHQAVIGNTVVNAIRSRAVTPVPSDFQISQSQLLQLVSQGQINSAFKQALSVNDLTLVMFLCEKVNPSQIFNQSLCPLQPPVLLALISQLSTDFESHSELKHEYLKEALVNLDFSDPIILNHSPRVIETLRQKLQNYIQAHPTSKISKDIRLLLMATHSFLKPNLPLAI